MNAAVNFILKTVMDANVSTEPVVRVSEGAAEEVKNLQTQPENSGKHLRLYVEQGGCSGMQYAMVFDEKRPDDAITETHGISVLVDPFSVQYLRGSAVDFSDSLTGGGFKISNPNARHSCGCGKSFET